jgi:hypothetical protein
MTRDERLLVLRLLREGKITTEEAERLLRALAAQETDSARSSKGWSADDLFAQFRDAFRHFDPARFAGELRSVGERVRRAFEDVERGAHPSADSPPPRGPWRLGDGSTVRITQKGGNVIVAPASGVELSVAAPTLHVDISEEGRRAEVSAVGGIARVELPPQVRRVFVEAMGGGIEARDIAPEALTARTFGGRILLDSVESDVEADATGGSITLRDVVSQRLDAETHGGSISAEFGDVREGTFRLQASGGALTVALGPGSEFEAEYSVAPGSLHSEWGTAAAGEDRIVVGSGGAQFRLAAHGGVLEIRRRTQ